MTNWGPTGGDRHLWWKRRGHLLSVWVDGVDVTDRCRFFDDTATPPVAELYRRNAEGRFYKEHSTDDDAVMEIVHDFEVRDERVSPEDAGERTKA